MLKPKNRKLHVSNVMYLVYVIMKTLCIIIILFALFTSLCHCNDSNTEDNKYWRNLGKQDILRALNVQLNTKIAKNVIIFIGDGMGMSTITAARIYAKTEKGYFRFETFPHVGALKTYSADHLVPDSACTATALFCGIKGNQKTAGVDASVKKNDCEASLKPSARLESIINWAQKAGKGTGFVTTTRVTHATPSALYAHVPNRNWECEAKIPKNATKCKDIARQLIEDLPGRNINVIMGGGTQCFRANTTDSLSDPIDTWACQRKDGIDLIKHWKEEKESRGVTNKFITNNRELAELENPEYVLGIFANGHLKMEHERDKGPNGMPSLANMTTAAIKLLKKHEKGFVLVVEGGMIDFAHHRGFAKKALSETVAFNEAIEQTMEMIKDEDREETLVIVTSDHSHSMVVSGYAKRGTKITDIAQKSKIDQNPYTSLLYGTGGPNNYKYKVVDNSVVREDPSQVDPNDFNYSQQAAVITDEVTHEGSDVLVYAQGPMAHLFHSVHEQTYVAYVIGYAAGIGPFSNEDDYKSYNNSSTIVLNNLILLLILFHFNTILWF